ncbi:hypothetical protein [Kluyvera georgiana]|uniref:hypothetical protein n=1 Tax=Kluyvera georgiana TaxID=73098 RepID=UPI002304281F|nr:hypothetical protein [Kluyvera georgiana]MDA8492458.1 hypothetical protein [Kluyvera georgiana]
MAIFAVIATNEQAKEPLQKAIKARFEDSFVQIVGENTWLIDCPLATSKAVTEFLCGGANVNEFRIHSFLVLPVTSYYGMHHPTVWEWLQSKGI